MKHNPADPHLARPRPLRAVRRPRVHAALQPAVPVRAIPASRSTTSSASASGISRSPATPSLICFPARDHDRPARPGLRDRRRHGDGRALPGGDVQPRRTRTSSTTTPTCSQRRRPPGRHQPRSGVVRRPPAARQARRPLRLQPHPARWPDRPRVHEKTSASASRRTAGTSSTSTGWTRRRRGGAASQRRSDDRPSIIVARTHIGFGSPNKQDSSKAHGSPLGDDEIRLTKKAYGWPEDAQFLVPDEALAHTRGDIARARRRRTRDWKQRFDAYAPAHPPEAQQFRDGIAAPAATAGTRLSRRITPTTRRSRRASLRATSSNASARACRCSIGGSADLGESNNTALKGAGVIAARIPAAATCTTASASTRWAPRSTAWRARRRHPVRRHVPRLLRLQPAGDPHRRAERLRLDLRLHARQHRPGRRRPDAPADRAPRWRCVRCPRCT